METTANNCQPPQTTANGSWASLANSHPGTHALILGKGPSLDTWLAHGAPRPPNALLIGINDVTTTLPPEIDVPYSLTTHRQPAWAQLPTQFIVSLPALPDPHRHWRGDLWRKPSWAAHWFLHIHGLDIAREITRAEIADTHILCNQSSSAQPALHFAWYLGAQSLTLIGIDGPQPHDQHYGPARHTAYPSPPTPGPTSYSGMRRDTQALAEILYPHTWQHWSP